MDGQKNRIVVENHSWVQRNIGRNKQIPYKHNQVFLLMLHHGDEHVVGDASTCDVYLRSWWPPCPILMLQVATGLQVRVGGAGSS